MSRILNLHDHNILRPGDIVSFLHDGTRRTGVVKHLSEIMYNTVCHVAVGDVLFEVHREHDELRLERHPEVRWLRPEGR